MKFIFALFFVLSTLSSKDIKIINYGFYYKHIFSSVQEVEKVMKLWEQHFNLRADKIRVKIHLYNDMQNFYDDYLVHKKLDLITVSPIEFFEHKEVLIKYSQSPWVFQMSKDEFFQYYLIKNKKSKHITTKSLKNLSLMSKDGDGNALLWFNKFCYENYKKGFSKIVLEHRSSLKQAKVVYKLFFNKVDLALVAKPAYDIMSELNPQITDNLEIIAKSPAIFSPVLGLFNQNNSVKDVAFMKNEILEVMNTIAGQNIFSVADINTVKFVDFNYYNDFESFYLEYKRLKNEYE